MFGSSFSFFLLRVFAVNVDTSFLPSFLPSSSTRREAGIVKLMSPWNTFPAAKIRCENIKAAKVYSGESDSGENAGGESTGCRKRGTKQQEIWITLGSLSTPWRFNQTLLELLPFACWTLYDSLLPVERCMTSFCLLNAVWLPFACWTLYDFLLHVERFMTPFARWTL